MKIFSHKFLPLPPQNEMFIFVESSLDSFIFFIMQFYGRNDNSQKINTHDLQ